MPALDAPPAPSPTATPTPSPSPSPAPAPSGGGSDFDSKLESLIGSDAPDPKAAAAPVAKPAAPEPPKAGDKKPDAKAAPAAPKPGDKPAEPKPAVPPKESGPKELREEKDRWKTRASELETKMADYEAKIKAGEALGKDMEAMKAKLEQREKEFEAVQGRLRAKEFEASPEFKKQYGDPLEHALSDARETISTMVKTDNAQADFERDVLPIFHASKKNYGQAYAAARELFGDDQAPAIMQHVTELRRLESAHNRALTAEQANWKERIKQEEGNRVIERQRDNETFWKIAEDLKNSNEDYRDPVDDAELATERNKGFDLFAARYHAKDKNERLLLDNHIRHQLGAYHALKLQNARHTAKIAELEAAIEESKPRQPGSEPRKPGGDSAPATEKSFEEAVAAGEWKQ